MKLIHLFMLLIVLASPAITVESIAFPIRASSNGHYLIDNAGKPFLYHADTPWTLTSRLRPADVDEYLRIRDQQGFNSLQVMIASFRDHTNNWEGQAPFINQDISRPNEAYFKNVDMVLGKASARGFMLMLAPLWFGYQAGDYHPHLTDANAYGYGRFLGQRFGGLKNVMWMLGGDSTPRGKENALRLLAQGLKDGGSPRLTTYHSGGETGSSAKIFGAADWHTLTSAYTYGPTYRPVVSDYFNAAVTRPIILTESGYEGESNDGGGGSPQRMRRQAWWVMLSGAAGHAYGCANVWNFGSDWRTRLLNAGALDMAHVKSMLGSRQWWTLVPDQQNTVLVDGAGTSGSLDYATAARANDGSFAVIYAPSARTLTVDLNQLGGEVTARWFDPTSAQWRSVAGSPFTNGGIKALAMPAKNDDGGSDHVLLLERTQGTSPTSDVGINLAGNAVTIDGLRWLSFQEAKNAGLTTVNASAWSGNYPSLSPQADTDQKAMLQSVLYRSQPANGSGFTLSYPARNGTYDVWVWAVENYRSGFRNVDLQLEGKTVATAIGDLPLWEWKKYGPFRTVISDGALTVDALRNSKGDPLLTGILIRPIPSAPDVIGINLAGQAVTIEEQQWMSQVEAANRGLSIESGATWSGTYPALSPSANGDLKKMLESVVYRSGVTNGAGFTLSYPVENGTYDVSVYMVENYRSGFRSTDLLFEGKVAATNLGDLPLWIWQKYGPYRAVVADGALTIKALRHSKGDPLLSGLLIERVPSTNN